MLYIVVEDKDMLYSNGMEIFLKQIFANEKRMSVHVSALSEDTVGMADIIVKSFGAGERCICHPILRNRKPDSLLIGVCEGRKSIQYIELPLCINNAVFINRTESLSRTKKLIVRGWEDCVAEYVKRAQRSCLDCPHRTLSPQQVKVAAHFYRGVNPEKIASDLQISIKTVCAHKHMIMNKFNLDSDCELLHFLHGVKQQKLMPNLFSECLTGN